MHHYQRRLSRREPLDRYDEEEEEDRKHCETFRRSSLAEYVLALPQFSQEVDAHGKSIPPHRDSKQSQPTRIGVLQDPTLL
jgi:hypothetical protein